MDDARHVVAREARRLTHVFGLFQQAAQDVGAPHIVNDNQLLAHMSELQGLIDHPEATAQAKAMLRRGFDLADEVAARLKAASRKGNWRSVLHLSKKPRTDAYSLATDLLKEVRERRRTLDTLW